MSAQRYDCVVVGTGQAGVPLAKALAAAGQQTAIIERGRVGGTCVLTGCTPSKTMLASAEVAHLASRASDYGVETGPVSVHLERVRARKRGIVDLFSDSSREGLVDQEGLTLIDGRARFEDPHTLRVELGDAESELGGHTQRIIGDRIFLDVGGRPRIPHIEGLEDVAFLDSTSIMELSEAPGHLAILGAGPVGIEFGQMFRRFGSRVTMIEQADRMLSGEDEDVGEEMRRRFEDEGITVLTSAEVTRVASNGSGVTLELHGNGEREISADALLVAVGRVPNSDTLDLDNAGIEPDEKGYIPVDERCRTGVEAIWALGDVTGSPPFTHVAYDDYRVVAADVLEGRPARTRDRMRPYVIFTDPELARVGLNEREAREQGVDYRLARVPAEKIARAIETDRTDGFYKCLVDAETDRILGATIFADQGGEIMTVLQVAMMGDLPYTAIRDGVIAHPTRAEGLQTLFASLDP